MPFVCYTVGFNCHSNGATVMDFDIVLARLYIAVSFPSLFLSQNEDADIFFLGAIFNTLVSLEQAFHHLMGTCLLLFSYIIVIPFPSLFPTL